MTFLIMLSVMLLSRLMILLSTLSVRRYLICGKLELPLELASVLRDTLEWGMKWVVVSIAGKTELVTFVWFGNSCAIDAKMDMSVHGYKSSFKMMVISLLNLSSLFLSEFSLSWGYYLYLSIYTVVLCCYLDMSDKPQKLLYRTVALSLAAFLDPLAHCWNIINANGFYSCYFGVNSSELAELIPFHFSITMPRTYKDIFVNNFFP